MHRIVATILALLVLFLGIAGLATEDGRLLGLNVDTPIDVLRIALGTVLLVAGLVLRTASRILLVATGALYLAMGGYAVVDASLGGVLPTGFDGLDIGFHLVAGALALGVGLVKGGRREPSMGTEHRAGQSHDPSIGR